MQYFTRVLRFHPSQNDQEQMDDLADFGQHTYLICKLAFKASSVLYGAHGGHRRVHGPPLCDPCRQFLPIRASSVLAQPPFH